MQDKRVFAFYGNMGAGKTTFIKALCEAMGVEDEVNSPTFALVNEYYIPKTDRHVYHFDFYRINKEEEVYDIGYEDLLESIINSDNIIIRLNESNLIEIQKSSEGFTYTILEGVDVSKMNTEILIESWNGDSDKISDLLKDIEHSIL